MMKYEIVLPVLNEEVRMPIGVKTLVAYMREFCKSPWSVVIADNGSVDRTAELIKELCATYPEVSGIRLDAPGVGRALKTVWVASNSDVIGYMDVDLSTDLATMQQVFSYFQDDGSGIFNGSRNSHDSVVRLRKPFRTFTSKSLNVIYRSLLSVPIDDCMCGFKFMRRSTYQKIAEFGPVNDGWFFCAEILAIAHYLKIPLFEVPVHWTDSPSDRVHVLKLAKNYMAEILKLRVRLRSIQPNSG